MRRTGRQKSCRLGFAGRLAFVLLAVPAAAALAVASDSTAGSPPVSSRPVVIHITFTGKGGGRYLDVTRWLREDTRECYARRTADETLAVSWRLSWGGRLAHTATGYVLEESALRGATIQGRVTGTSVRDSCDAAEEEEPGWTGSDHCNGRLPVRTKGNLAVKRSGSKLQLSLRGPVFGSPGHPCELEIRNDQLAAQLPLTSNDLARAARGGTVRLPVGTAHPRPGDAFLATKNCSSFPHIYEGVVYLYDCDDTLTWRGSVTIASS